MKNNFKFLIVLAILLAGCFCIGSTFAADISVEDINDVSSVDNTQNIEIAHDDSSQNDVEITKVSADDPGNFTELRKLIQDALSDGNNSITLTKDYKFVSGDVRGIEISESFNINGKNHVIEGSDLISVFIVRADNVEISNLNFVNVKSNLGAINWNGKNGNLSKCNFINCSANYNGGAVYWTGDEGSIRSCDFINCSANYNGGAVYLTGNESHIEFSDFINCSANYNGGAVYWNGTDSFLIFCKFINCSANDGGAINLIGESCLLEDSDFINCSAKDDGGAVYWGDVGTIKNCDFLNCSAKDDGGAIYWSGYDGGSIISCDFTKCLANKGSAIYIYYSVGIFDSTCTPVAGDKKAPIYNKATISSDLVITTINGTNMNATYDDKVNLTAVVTTSGISVAGAKIKFSINGNEILATSDDYGIYSTLYAVDFVGTKPVNATYINGNSQVLNAYNLTSIPRVLDINVSVYAIYGKNISGFINITSNGNITFIIDGVTFTAEVLNGDFIIPNTVSLNVKNYTNIPVSFVSTDGGYIGNTTVNFVMLNTTGSFNIAVEDITYGDSFTITISNASSESDERLSGNVVVTINGNEYNLTVTNGSGSKVVSDILPAGNYLVNATLTNSHYILINNSTSFTVAPKNIIILTFVDNSVYGENLTGTLNASGKAGNISVTINGTVYKTTVDSEGKFTLNGTDSLNAGYYQYIPVSFISDDGNYIGEDDCAFAISRRNIPINATINNITYGDNFSGSVSADLPGMIDVHPGEGPISYEFDTIGPFTTEWDEENILGAGTYTGHVIFLSDDGNYIGKTNVSYNIAKADLEIIVSVDNITYGEDAVVNVTVNGAGNTPTGNVTIFVNGTEVANVTLTDGKCSYNMSYLGAGNYNITARYNGNQNYTISEGNGNLTVNKAGPTVIILNASNYIYGANITLGVNVSGSGWVAPNGNVWFITWNITVPLNDEGIASINVGVLKSGLYPCYIEYIGNENYTHYYDNTYFFVDKASPEVTISVDNITYGEDAVVNVSVSGAGDTPTGNVTFYLGTDEITVDLDENGTASYTFTGLSAGDYYGNVKYNGDGNYNSTLDQFEFNVAKADPEVLVDIGSERSFDIKFGDTVVAIVTLPSDVTGNVSFSIDNETWETVPITNNSAEYDIPGLDAGNYILFVKYNGDDNYNPTYSENPFNIRQLETTVTVDPVKGKAGEKVTITARVTDEDGNPVEDGYVIIGFNGKEYKAYVENGIATVEIVLPSAGTYSATAYYEGFNYNSSYTVFTVEVSAVPGPNPNPNPTNPVNGGVGNMENTGNPLVVLLIALCAIGLESFRRKF